ncbi:MAG: phosphoglycerate dehydrogenase [Desulfobacterales bacterium]|nr:phosphoglycerate dehydrogenase [Desulfobacterales bacterium]
MKRHDNKILIGPSSFAAVDKMPLNSLLATGFEVVNNPFGRKLTKKELIDLLPGVTGLIAGLEPLDREVMELSDLKVISRCGSGVSNVDQEAARNLGITVCSTPDGPTNSVAELTVGVLLSLLRSVPAMDKALHNNVWDKRIGVELCGKTVLLIGFGKIGQRVSELMKPFQVTIVASDPFLSGKVGDVNILPLEQALRLADIVSIHASGVNEILGEREFSIMKNGVFILNAARGGLIDEDCLVSGLESGKITAAWLDSYSQEPYSGPLTRFSQVILTPHIGSYTQECRLRMETEAVENLLSALAGKVK